MNEEKLSKVAVTELENSDGNYKYVIRMTPETLCIEYHKINSYTSRYEELTYEKIKIKARDAKQLCKEIIKHIESTEIDFEG